MLWLFGDQLCTEKPSVSKTGAREPDGAEQSTIVCVKEKEAVEGWCMKGWEKGGEKESDSRQKKKSREPRGGKNEGVEKRGGKVTEE